MHEIDLDELDPEEQALLSAARQGLGPSVAQTQRVWKATQRVVGAAPGLQSEDSPVFPATAHTLSMGSGLTSHAVRLWILRGLAMLALAGMSAGLGYRAGWRAAHDAHRPDANHGADAQPSMAEANRVGEGSDAQDVRGTPAGDRHVPPASPPPTLASAASEVPNALPHGSRSRRASPSESAGQVAPGPSELEAELRMLRDVERSLRRGDSRQALALLQVLDERFPEGRLREERAAAHAIARCGLGLGTPQALVRRFALAHPESAYTQRVRQACLGSEGTAPH